MAYFPSLLSTLNTQRNMTMPASIYNVDLEQHEQLRAIVCTTILQTTNYRRQRFFKLTIVKTSNVNGRSSETKITGSFDNEEKMTLFAKKWQKLATEIPITCNQETIVENSN